MTRSSRWQSTARWGRAAARAILLSIVLGTAFGGGAALAGDDSFCGGCWVSSGSYTTGPTHSLTATRGTNQSTGSGCGGAVSYGSYYCADPSGCHTYSGNNMLTPGIRHRSSGGKPMSGYSTWGSTGAPGNCVYSSVYSVGGPILAAAANPDGVPVLDRAVSDAPAAVGALVPNADRRAARSFQTPAGEAWVLVEPEGRLICLVVDDRGTGYGYSCQRVGAVRAAGTLATLEDADVTTGLGDVVIALAPEGVDALKVKRRDGAVREVAVKGGVAVTTLGSKDEEVTLPVAEDAPAGTKARKFSAAN